MTTIFSLKYKIAKIQMHANHDGPELTIWIEQAYISFICPNVWLLDTRLTVKDIIVINVKRLLINYMLLRI